MDKRFKKVTREDMADFSPAGEEKPFFLFGAFEVILFFWCFILVFLVRPESGTNISFIALIALFALTLLFLIPTIYFNNEKRLARHRKEYVICKIIGIQLSSLAFAAGLLYVTAVGLNNSGNGDLVPVLPVCLFVLIAAFDVLFTSVIWKVMKKLIFSGSARENGAIRVIEKNTYRNTHFISYFCLFVILLLILLSFVTSISDSILMEFALPLFLLYPFKYPAFHCAKLIGRYVYLSLFGSDEENDADNNV